MNLLESTGQEGKNLIEESSRKSRSRGEIIAALTGSKTHVV